MSSPTKLRQMAKELGWPPELEKAADQLQKLERENAELRNEIARLNNQTNWVCKCGGTDCEGQKENAALNHALNIAQTELRLNGCAKAADEVAKLHDAARKEAQP